MMFVLTVLWLTLCFKHSSEGETLLAIASGAMAIVTLGLGLVKKDA